MPYHVDLLDYRQGVVIRRCDTGEYLRGFGPHRGAVEWSPLPEQALQLRGAREVDAAIWHVPEELLQQMVVKAS